MNTDDATNADVIVVYCDHSEEVLYASRVCDPDDWDLPADIELLEPAPEPETVFRPREFSKITSESVEDKPEQQASGYG